MLFFFTHFLETLWTFKIASKRKCCRNRFILIVGGEVLIGNSFVIQQFPEFVQISKNRIGTNRINKSEM